MIVLFQSMRRFMLPMAHPFLFLWRARGPFRPYKGAYGLQILYLEIVLLFFPMSQDSNNVSYIWYQNQNLHQYTKIPWNPSCYQFLTFLFILMDQKYLESRFIILCWSKEFQKGMISISFNDRIKTTSNVMDWCPLMVMHGHKIDKIRETWADGQTD